MMTARNQTTFIRGSAFTLIELLVVIGIIGVLLAILLPALSMVRERAQRTDCSNRLRQLCTASQMYCNQFGQFPPVPMLPALSARAPSGVTSELLNQIRGQLKWPTIGDGLRVDELPAIAACPARLQVPLFMDSDLSYGVPIRITGYMYTPGLDDAQNANGVVLRRDRIAARRATRRGVLWADTLLGVTLSGGWQGYSFFHYRGSLNFNTVTGTLTDFKPLQGQHRGSSDGSVEWVPRQAVDLNPLNANRSASYRIDAGPLVLHYYF